MYSNLNYTEGGWLVRFYPIWFLMKRYCFIAVVFNFDYTQGMLLTFIYITVYEIGVWGAI